MSVFLKLNEQTDWDIKKGESRIAPPVLQIVKTEI